MTGEKTVKSPSKAPAPQDLKFAGRLAGTLLGICAVTALLLGLTNALTQPRINAIQQARREAAMRQVFPADEYAPVEGELPENISAWYTVHQGGTQVGWVVETSAPGSQGPIALMVGVTTGGTVTGVSAVKHSETPNLGTKVVADQTVLDRFIGMSHENGEITVNAGANRVDGVSGATITFRGVAAGVNAALDALPPGLERAKEG